MPHFHQLASSAILEIPDPRISSSLCATWQLRKTLEGQVANDATDSTGIIETPKKPVQRFADEGKGSPKIFNGSHSMWWSWLRGHSFTEFKRLTNGRGTKSLQNWKSHLLRVAFWSMLEFTWEEDVSFSFSSPLITYPEKNLKSYSASREMPRPPSHCAPSGDKRGTPSKCFVMA